MACALVVLASAALVLTFDYGRDQAIYALVAREMLAGGMPYRDAFDFKPPGIFVVYAVARAIFGEAHFGIRVLEALSMLGTTLGLVRLARWHAGSTLPGWIAAALAAQVHAQLDFWHTGQPESFGGTLTVLGLLAATHAHASVQRGARLRGLAGWLGTGVVFGIAGLMKPPLAGGGAVVAGLAALVALVPRLQAAEGRPGRALGDRALEAGSILVATALGGALPILATIGWFAARGALHDMHQVLLVFTPYYTKLGWENASVLGLGYYGISEWLMTYSGALLFGLLSLVVARPARREVPLVVAASLVIVVHIAGVVMQAKFFPYHWGATFPVTAILAGLGLDHALRWAMARGPVVVALLAVVFGIAAVARAPVPNMGPSFLLRAGERFDLFVRGPRDQARRDALAAVGGVFADQNREVAAYVRAHTAPGEPIFVWGFECVIYDQAERPLSSRYIYDVPQRATWSRAPLREALMRDLEARPPAAIVVEHQDVFGFVTGDELDSAGSLHDFDAFTDLLQSDYDYEKRIGNFDVYLRRAAERQPHGD